MDNFTKYLQQFNVLEVIMIFWIFYFLEDMWNWFELHQAELTMQGAGVFSSLVLLIAGCLKMALTNVMKRWQKHES